MILKLHGATRKTDKMQLVDSCRGNKALGHSKAEVKAHWMAADRLTEVLGFAAATPRLCCALERWSLVIEGKTKAQAPSDGVDLLLHVAMASQ